MRRTHLIIKTLLIFHFLIINCTQNESEQVMELKFYSADNPDGIISLSSVTLDSTDFTEGSASLRITTEKPQIIKLFETGDVEVKNARIFYQAQLKCANLDGEAYLEMWCHFPGKGEFYSRALHSKISGDTGWSTHETIFTLSGKENPDNVKLNLVINGSGTVWIDDIRLLYVPLQE